MGRTPDLPPCNYHGKRTRLEKWFRVIRRGTYQAAYEDNRWEYETVSDLCPYIAIDSYSINDGSSDEGRKYRDNSDYQEQEEVVSVPHMNPRRLRQDDQI